MILVVCLLVFGPRKLPEIARTVGRAIREFRSASDEIVREITRPAPDPAPRRSRVQNSEISAEAIPVTATTVVDAPGATTPDPDQMEVTPPTAAG